MICCYFVIICALKKLFLSLGRQSSMWRFSNLHWHAWTAFESVGFATKDCRVFED